ncbi:MAG: DNA-processing protein DprA [Sporichthyaceae bacterium]
MTNRQDTLDLWLSGPQPPEADWDGGPALDHEERAARALLMRVAEPAQVPLGRALARYGAVGVVDRIRSGYANLPQAAAMCARMAGLDPLDDIEAGEAAGATLICPGDRLWPRQLDDLGPTRPFGLWCLGGHGLRPALVNSVAMVGARAASPYGVHVATDLAAQLAERGWTVVSGGAFGVDVAAHRGTLAVDGTTVAVLAGGVDVPYPRAHAALFERIGATGAVLSEAALGASPESRRFLTRNRLIAALTRGTVVVEAAARSGAATTARWADELNRVLMVVPGPVTSATSIGSNDLLRSRHALAVTRAAEVVEALGRIGEDLAPPHPRPARSRDHLPPEVRDVLEALPARGVADVDRLAVACGIAGEAVRAALGELAALGLVERVDGGWRTTSEARRR